MVDPVRTVRIPDDLWDAAKAKAKSEGLDVSMLIRKCLRRYVRER